MRTLEDEVAASPDGLGLSQGVIQQARARVEYFRGIRQSRGGRGETAEAGGLRQATQSEVEEVGNKGKSFSNQLRAVLA